MSTTRVCNLCEAMCGLTVARDAEQQLTLRGNPDDVFSAGAFCPKSQGLLDLYQDPDRLRRPLKRDGERFVEVSWQAAFDDIGTKVLALQKQHGVSTIATYLGNPNSHHAGNIGAVPFFLKALRTRNKYSATSVDQLPQMLAAYLMFGHQLLLPIADVDHTDYLLILGANPAVSSGSLLSRAGLSTRIKAIAKRGGKVVVLDPRYTETASLASEHHFVKPGSDAVVLAAIVQRLLKAPRLRHLEGQVDGLSELTVLFDDLPWTSAELATLTGVGSALIEEIAGDLLRYDRAICYGRVGVSTQRFGGLCAWLINLINILSGNLDRPGGVLFTHPAIDIVALMAKMGSRGSFNRRRSRVRQLPEFSGELPAATMADEMLTPGEGQVHGLFTIAGNPVLSLPNGPKLEQALAGLDLYVAIDFYKNETTRFAHYILPPTSPIEQSHYDLIFNVLAGRNIVRYSAPLAAPPPDSYEDWEILMELWARFVPPRRRLQRLRRRLAVAFARRRGLEFFLNLGLRLGPYKKAKLSVHKLLAHPNGIDLGALRPSMPQRLFTPNKKVQLFPVPMCDAWQDLCSELPRLLAPQPQDALVLIGRRHLKSNNSWMHNCPSLVKGKSPCYVQMHTHDAAQRQLASGSMVRVVTSIGAVELPLLVNDKIMPGVIAIPHGWGHHRAGTQMAVAQRQPGVSLNDVLDDGLVDAFCGNAAFSGQSAQVQALP